MNNVETLTIEFTRNGKTQRAEVEVQYYGAPGTAQEDCSRYVRKVGSNKFFGSAGYWAAHSSTIKAYRGQVKAENVVVIS